MSLVRQLLNTDSNSSKAVTIDGEASSGIELISNSKTDFSTKTAIGQNVPEGAVKM